MSEEVKTKGVEVEEPKYVEYVEVQIPHIRLKDLMAYQLSMIQSDRVDIFTRHSTGYYQHIKLDKSKAVMRVIKALYDALDDSYSDEETIKKVVSSLQKYYQK